MNKYNLKSTGELKEAIASIVAILNKHGSGDLYFGVRNDGTEVGQDITDHTLREVSQAIRTHIKPVIYPDVLYYLRDMGSFATGLMAITDKGIRYLMNFFHVCDKPSKMEDWVY